MSTEERALGQWLNLHAGHSEANLDAEAPADETRIGRSQDPGATSQASAAFMASLPADVAELANGLVSAPPATSVKDAAQAFSSDFATKLAAGQIPGVPANPALVGKLPGEISVDDSGSARYTIPLSVPIGRGEMTPSLSLVYSSAGGDGILGQGWSLSMPPVIRKCDPWGVLEAVDDLGVSSTSHTVAQSKERLCYGDLPLVRVSGPEELEHDRLSAGLYRTVPDTFVQIEVRDSTPSLTMEVREKGGLVHLYARHHNAEWWERASTVDRFGNDIAYSRYTCVNSGYSEVDPENRAASMNAPCRISYVRDDDPSCIDPQNVGACYRRNIEFEYVPHPKARVVYGPGGPMKMDRLLKRIHIRASGHVDEGWSYIMDYGTGTATGRSVLKSVTLCTDLGQCLPATKFEYADQSPREPARFTAGPSISLGNATMNKVWGPEGPGGPFDWSPSGAWPSWPRVEDINHDGRDDILWNNGGQDKVAISQVDGTFVLKNWEGDPWPKSGPDDGPMVEADVNGDGLRDIIECVDEPTPVDPLSVPLRYWYDFTESGRLGRWQLRLGTHVPGESIGARSFRTLGHGRPCVKNSTILGVYSGFVPSAYEASDKEKSWRKSNSLTVWDQRQRDRSAQLLLVRHGNPRPGLGGRGSLEFTDGRDAYSVCDVGGNSRECEELPGLYWNDPDPELLPLPTRDWQADRFERDVNGDGQFDLSLVEGDGGEARHALRVYPDRPIAAQHDETNGVSPYLFVSRNAPEMAKHGAYIDWNEDGLADVLAIAYPPPGADATTYVPAWRVFLAHVGDDGLVHYSEEPEVALGAVGGGALVQPIFEAEGEARKQVLHDVLEYGYGAIHETGIDGTYGHIWGDFDGDGRQDYASLHRLASPTGTMSLNVRLRTPLMGGSSDSRPLADALVRVTDGMGGQANIDYLPLSDARVTLDTSTTHPGSDEHSSKLCKIYGSELERCRLVSEVRPHSVVWRLRQPIDNYASDHRRDTYRYGRMWRNADTNQPIGFDKIEHTVWNSRTNELIRADLRFFSTELDKLGGRLPRYEVRGAGMLSSEFQFELEEGSDGTKRVAVTSSHTNYERFDSSEPGREHLWVAPYFVAPSTITTMRGYLAGDLRANTLEMWSEYLGSSIVVSASNIEYDRFGNRTLDWTRNYDDAPSSDTIVTNNYEYVTDPAAIEAWQVGLPRRMTVSRESNVVTPTSSMPKVQTQVREFSYCPTEPCSLAHYERARLHTEVVAPGDPIHESIRRFEYNDWGQPAIERSMHRSGQPGEVYTDELVISTTYDSAEHLFAVRVDNNVGHFTTRAFDWRFGRPIYEIDANGREQAWGFDLLQRNVYHLERGGLPPTGPFAGIWTTTQYERTLSGSGPSPFKVTVRSLDGSWSSKVFDTRGRLVSESAPVLDGSTRTKYYRYNFHGKVSDASLPTMGAASSSGAANASYAQSFYDRSGRLIKTIEPNGRTLLFDAQSTGRGMWKRTTEGGVRKSYSIYSAGGRLLASIDGVGNQRCFAYEPDGKVNATWVLKAGMGSGTPSLAACYSASNMFGAATVMVNDDYGHTSEINDPEAGRHEFRRDAAGRPVWEKDALGHESRLVYDALGRVTQKIIGSETTFQTWDEQMKGSLSSVSGPWGVVKKVHDNLGRVRAEVTRYTGDTEDVVFKYNYSPIHNKLESVDLPQPGTSPKFKFNYRYNSVGQLDAVLNTSKTWAYWRALGVDMLGNVSQEAYGVDPFDSGWAHSWTTRNYVPLTGALTRLTAYGYNAGYIDLLQDFVVMRQQNNQVWRRVDALMGQGEIYTYDNADRLRRAEVEHWAGNLVTDYNYDPLGNLTTKSDIGTMAYGMQYANPRALTRAGSVYYSYDANGNVIERGPLGAKDSYAWDEGNRLSEIASSDGVNLSFDYNSDGQRIRRTSTDGSQWSYYGVYSREKRRASQGGGIEHHYRVTLGGRTLCELTFVPGGTYTFDFIHEDERNSPNVITRSGVGIIERMAFDVYGRKRDPANWANRNGTFFNDSNATVGFTGHAELQDDSLTWMGSRHFDSYAGRFIKPDTIVADPSSTQGWARYTYVENDPVNFTDPSGHQRYDPDRPVYSWWGEVYEQAMFWGVGAGTLAAMWNVTMPSSEFWDESKMQQNTALGSGESSGTWTVVHQIIHVVQAPPEGAPVVASDGTRSNGFGVTIVVHYSHSHSVVAGVSLHAGDDPTKIDVNDATLHDFDHETMPGAKSEFNSSDVLLGSSPFIIVMLAEVAAYLAGGGTVATLLGLQEGSAAGTGGASAGVASDAAASAPTLVAAAKAIPRVGQTAKNITEVTISSLRALHAVPRPGMPANHIQNLAQSIRTNGYDLNQAISVMRLPSGQLVSAGGHHRVAAMQSLGETTIPARVVDWSSMSTGAQQWYLNNFPSLGELLQ